MVTMVLGMHTPEDTKKRLQEIVEVMVKIVGADKLEIQVEVEVEIGM